jgi:hypothetical protein
MTTKIYGSFGTSSDCGDVKQGVWIRSYEYYAYLMPTLVLGGGKLRAEWGGARGRCGDGHFAPRLVRVSMGTE